MPVYTHTHTHLTETIHTQYKNSRNFPGPHVTVVRKKGNSVEALGQKTLRSEVIAVIFKNFNMAIKFNTDNSNCPPISCLPIARHQMNCPIPLQYIQANYLLIPILRVPLAYMFILLRQSKLPISQIHYSSITN